MKILSALLFSLLLALPLTAQESATSQAAEETYTVLFGDTLDSIAQELDVSVICLVLANSLTNANQLEAGQVLAVGADCAPYDAIESDIIANMADLTLLEAETPDLSGIGDSTVYQVRYGDTLDTIAQTYDVSVTCLQITNGIANANQLRFSQILVILTDCDPYSAVDSSISSQQEMLIGSGRIVSDGQGGGAVPATPQPAEAITYDVQTNDNLMRIAAEYEIPLLCLQAENNITDANLIYPGQVLVIPTDCETSGGSISEPRYQCLYDRNAGREVIDGSYTVQAGDTLDFIGCDLNMNTQCLAQTNALSNRGRIAIGQQLIISTTCTGWYPS